MKILKQIYSELIKDIYKVFILFFFVKKEKNTNKKKLIIINNQYHEDFSWVNYILGSLLKKKGYNVKFLVCGGNSYCERMTYTIEKPNCKICHFSNILKLKSFGHEYIISNQINKNTDIEDFDKFLDNKFDHLNFEGNDYSTSFKTSYLHYFKGKLKSFESHIGILKKLFYTSVKTLSSTKKIINTYKPFKIITINGKNIQTGILFRQAINNNIDCYTWDVFNQGFKSMISKNEIAHNQNISNELWNKFKLEELSLLEKKRIKEYMYLQSKSLNTPFRYYDENAIEEKKQIFDNLKLDPNKDTISIFPNTDWDSTNIGLDDAYKDPYNFIEKIVKFAHDNENYNVIIRCHPAEKKVSFHQRSSRPIDQFIREEYDHLIKKNLFLIEANSNISSYTLAKISKHRIVYTSTLGLEFSYMKLKTLVAGKAFYKFRGFTKDITPFEDLEKILKSDYQNDLSEKEFSLLEKFIYISKFRKLFNLDYFDNAKFKISSIKDFNKVFQNKTYCNIADYVLDKRDYLDLDK